MRKNYDFSKATKNPYAKKLKQQISIRLDDEVILYFKNLAKETGINYQSLINYYLRDCMEAKKKVKLSWDH
ncbi:BrnA antitoxin family protein [bacterium]|nr:BrnA antitoxin family protein [bacterium]